MTPYVDTEEVKVRVLAVIRNSLLGDILDDLLSTMFNLHLCRVRCVSPESLWQGINQYQPEVIVLEEGLVNDTALSFAGQALVRGRVRIILISPAENRVQVYDRFQISLTQTADFVALIEDYPRYQV